METKQAFHVMAKPTGARCNLGCQYCYFLEKETLYPDSTFRMSDKVLEEYIRQSFDSQEGTVVEIAWQGGEPTLMGLEFFRKAIALEQKYQKPGVSIHNTLQTNGTLLDDEWCSFLRENHFLVGISLDGPRQLHDALRTDKQGHPTFERVMKGIGLLQEHHVEFNILCTINAANGDHPLAVYRFLRDDIKASFIQLIPIVEPESGFSVKPQQFGKFLNTIFDEWIRRDVGKVFIQYFDAALAAWLFGESSLCIFQPTCGKGLVLEHNGDLYACDHFVEASHLLGNILEKPLLELATSEQQRKFGKTKLETLSETCQGCEVLFACQGECPKNRVGDLGQNFLCAGYKAFFNHIAWPMQRMATLLRQGLPAEGIMQILAEEARKTGRNAPCPCGSGLKFKKCHGAFS